MKSYVLGVLVGGILIAVFVFGKQFFEDNTSSGSVPNGNTFSEDANTVNGFSRKGMPSSDNYEGTPPEFENGGALNDSNYLNRQAQILGISVEELESEIAAGKTFEELAEEKGISLTPPPGMSGGRKNIPNENEEMESSQEESSEVSPDTSSL